MKIKYLSDPEIIMSNENSYHDYFAWPTVSRLQNGKLAVGASGFRLNHVCPFGKSVMAISENEGESWSMPAPVIDTVLDDRDVGLATFGKSGVIFSSFNNTVEFQKSTSDKYSKSEKEKVYRNAYLDMIDMQDQEKYLGSVFRISDDFGVTFGPIHKSPITSPHGPCELSDGSVLWVGRAYDDADAECEIQAYNIDTKTGKMTFVGQIESIFDGEEKLMSCEPHAIQLPDGKIICHIRVQYNNRMNGGKIFTLYQSVSSDMGKTWTKPSQIIGDVDGAPAHLLYTKDGDIVCVHSKREAPYSIRAIISSDGGQSWSKQLVIADNVADKADMGYPATVQLSDESFLTVYYAKNKDKKNNVIWQRKWTFEK